MCEVECRKRFERIEIKVNAISNDLAWMRWMVRTAVILIGGFLGLDLTGVV